MKLPLLSLTLAALSCRAGLAENPHVCLGVGDTAPVLTALDDQGKIWKSSDYVGKNLVVLFFYPADLTAGCTRQACGFQKDLADLKKAGATVVGVSGDAVSNHQLFKKAHSLSFPLLSDESGKVAHSFGVPVRDGGEIARIVEGQPKKLVRGVTAQRWTFVIGLDGTIIHRNTNVDAANDSRTVLKLVRQLTASRQ